MARGDARATRAELREFSALAHELLTVVVNGGRHAEGIRRLVAEARALRESAGGPYASLGFDARRLAVRRDAYQRLRWAHDQRAKLLAGHDRAKDLAAELVGHPGERGIHSFHQAHDGCAWGHIRAESAHQIVLGLALAVLTSRGSRARRRPWGEAQALFGELEAEKGLSWTGEGVRRLRCALDVEEWAALGPDLDPESEQAIRAHAPKRRVADFAERLLWAAQRVDVADGWTSIGDLLVEGFADVPTRERPDARHDRDVRRALDLLRDVGLLEDNGETKRGTRYRATHSRERALRPR